MVGKPVQEAVRPVPRLFGICGRAQGVAAAMAAEAALGMATSGQAQTMRMRLVVCEAVREHLWRILLDWPRLMGMQPHTAAMAAIRADMSEMLGQSFAMGEWPAAGSAQVQDFEGTWQAVVVKIQDVLRREIFGCDPAQWLELDTPEKLADWYGDADTLAAAVLRSLAQRPRFGAGRVALMPAPDVEWLRIVARAMQQEAGFTLQPDFRGSALETGALARQQRQPLIVELLAADENSVFVRVVARLVELARLASADGGMAWIGSLPLAENEGISWAETARGLLMHRMAVDGGLVAHYQIVAPTEWNFHADGAFVRGLCGVPAASAAEARNKAEWLVQSLDPCVACEVTMQCAEQLATAGD